MQEVMPGIFQMELMKQSTISRMLEVMFIKYSPLLVAEVILNLIFLKLVVRVSYTDASSNNAVKLAVVSNFDTRLRKLLKDLQVLDL